MDKQVTHTFTARGYRNNPASDSTAAAYRTHMGAAPGLHWVPTSHAPSVWAELSRRRGGRRHAKCELSGLEIGLA